MQALEVNCLKQFHKKETLNSKAAATIHGFFLIISKYLHLFLILYSKFCVSSYNSILNIYMLHFLMCIVFWKIFLVVNVFFNNWAISLAQYFKPLVAGQSWQLGCVRKNTILMWVKENQTEKQKWGGRCIMIFEPKAFSGQKKSSNNCEFFARSFLPVCTIFSANIHSISRLTISIM